MQPPPGDGVEPAPAAGRYRRERSRSHVRGSIAKTIFRRNSPNRLHRPLPADGGRIAGLPPARWAAAEPTCAEGRNARPGDWRGGAYSAALLRHIGLTVDTAATPDDATRAPMIYLIEGAAQQLPEGLAGKLVPGGRIGGAIVEDGVTPAGHGAREWQGVQLYTLPRASAVLASLSRPPNSHSQDWRQVKRHLLTGTVIAHSLADRLPPIRCATRSMLLTAAPYPNRQREHEGDRRVGRHRRAAGSSAALRNRGGQPRSNVERLVAQARQGTYLTGGWTSAIRCSTAGSVRNSIIAARTRVEAGRATLRAVEGDISPRRWPLTWT